MSAFVPRRQCRDVEYVECVGFHVFRVFYVCFVCYFQLFLASFSLCLNNIVPDNEPFLCVALWRVAGKAG